MSVSPPPSLSVVGAGLRPCVRPAAGEEGSPLPFWDLKGPVQLSPKGAGKK